ncbi:protease inhibitor I42 family protein [Pseudomonas sp. dw_358]|uniref:protease inhibitor I42 family protein n=1 Tax=Pseudomonas sp. dw_358 TaxID=2720083 RepID=UPI001BD3D7F5|nr:protease inhibitor I42 family protein [Pseudomonas sp. dw_358]
MTASRLLAATGLILLTACTANRQGGQNVTVTRQGDCPLHLQAGQKLTLTLPSDPTTGYRWRVRNAGQPVLRSLGPEVFSNPEDVGVVGAAGQSSWRFDVSQAGSGALLLVYQQPWAPEVNPIKSFECVIVVQ